MQTLIILRQNGFLRNYLNLKKLKKTKGKQRGNIAVNSSQTNAVQGLQVPPQNTTNTQGGEVSKNLCRESLGKIQFLIYSTGFYLVADQCPYPHTEIQRAQTINTTSKGWSKSITILLSILWSIQIPINSSNYNTTRVYKAQTTSTVNLFFERNQNRDDTAFENCSCLATWYTCLDIQIKKRRRKEEFA